MITRWQRILGGNLFKHFVASLVVLVLCGPPDQGKVLSTTSMVPLHPSHNQHRSIHNRDLTSNLKSSSPRNHGRSHHQPIVFSDHQSRLVNRPIGHHNPEEDHFSTAPTPISKDVNKVKFIVSNNSKLATAKSVSTGETADMKSSLSSGERQYVSRDVNLRRISPSPELLDPSPVSPVNTVMKTISVIVNDALPLPLTVITNKGTALRERYHRHGMSLRELQRYHDYEIPTIIASRTRYNHLVRRRSVASEDKVVAVVAQAGVSTTETPDERLLRREAGVATTNDETVGLKCQAFVVGNPVEQKFHSPNFPNHYLNHTNCVKVLSTDQEHLLRLDFRDNFHLEPDAECRYDFLEVRDGAHGYDNLIGRYCGEEYPPMITSSTNYLYLRFVSDENIEYSGFTAVYEFIERPTIAGPPPFVHACIMEVGGDEGLISNSHIDPERIRRAREYGSSVDCMWIIRVPEGWKIQLAFLNFNLDKPNDCVSNFVDVFTDQTDLMSRKKNFCSSMAEMVTSDTNILHVRFFVEAKAINSSFQALYTAYRDGKKKDCMEGEFDCKDETCIALSLKCNGNVNCKFRWDEEEALCQVQGGWLPQLFSSEHIIIILVIFCLILSGMCSAFLFNCITKLIHDHRIIREHLRQSREGRLDEISKAALAPRVLTSGRSRSNSSTGSALSPHHILRAVRSAVSGGSDDQDRAESPPRPGAEECYVPGAGDLMPILLGANRATADRSVPANGDAVFLRENNQQDAYDEEDDLEMPSFPLPEMRDNECQTRESLFMNSNSERSVTPPPPPPPISSRFNSSNSSSTNNRHMSPRTPHQAPPHPPHHHHHSSSNTSAFSTFGYKDNRRPEANKDSGGKDYSTLHHHHHHGGAESQRFRAEAVIEMEQARQNEENGGRPFSVDSTKSAPDVIVTH